MGGALMLSYERDSLNDPALCRLARLDGTAFALNRTEVFRCDDGSPRRQ
jgi:hypothetical protein